MLHFIENLLSTSPDRGIYQTLWLFSITKNNRVPNSKLNYDEINILDVCNNLIESWQRQDKYFESFFVSTQLAFGALYVYKYQIDKLHDQAQTALRSCRVNLFELDWTSQFAHSTPICKSQKSQEERSVPAKKGKNKKQQKVSIVDIGDEIEQFFKVLDDEPQVNNKGKKKKPQNNDDSLIDPTMAIDMQSITIIEQTSLLTSGYHSMSLATNFDEIDFNTEAVEEFRNLLMDSEPVNSHSQNLHVDMKIPAKRRLTYNEMECDISNIRGAPQLELPTIDFECLASSFDPKNVQEEAMDITAIPDIPQQVPEVPEIVPKMTQERNRESTSEELILEDISPMPKKLKLARKLIIDKETEFEQKTVSKNDQKYQKFSTVASPFDEYQKKLKLHKPDAETLLNNPSSNMKTASPLIRNIFDRNLKTISEKYLSKRKQSEIENWLHESQNDKENEMTERSAKRRKIFNRRPLKDNNEDVLQKEIEIPELPPAVEMNELEMMLPLEVQIPQPEEIELPPAIEQCNNVDSEKQAKKKKHRQRCQTSEEVQGAKVSKREVLTKLKDLWSIEDQSITMAKLTIGMSRISAARVFFELLALSKRKVIELEHQQNSLEIGNITCKMSAARISKLYF